MSVSAEERGVEFPLDECVRGALSVGAESALAGAPTEKTGTVVMVVLTPKLSLFIFERFRSRFTGPRLGVHPWPKGKSGSSSLSRGATTSPGVRIRGENSWRGSTGDGYHAWSQKGLQCHCAMYSVITIT